MIENFLDYLNRKEVEYKENQSLSKISSVKIGGDARVVVSPSAVRELILSVDFLEDNKINYKTVGRMSNILPDDRGFGGVILKTDKISSAEVKGNTIRVSAGASLAWVAQKALSHSLSGFEELFGIPGSVGGAVFSNAGAFDRSVSDLITYCEAYDVENRKIITLCSDELEFSYRNSLLKRKRYLLLNAEFSLSALPQDDIKSRMNEIRSKRLASQPTEPSLGSVFKRSGELAASRLVDLCGLKGRKCGGAEISEKHAGFIVNKGGATAEDYKTLVNLMSESVYKSFGVKLEREIEYLNYLG